MKRSSHQGDVLVYKCGLVPAMAQLMQRGRQSPAGQ